MPSDGRSPRRRSTLGATGAAGLGAMAGVVAIAILLATGVVGRGPAAAAAQADIYDPGSAALEDARFEVVLVHLGTDHPFTGKGAPGIDLRVEAEDAIVDWTVWGWANETTPQPQPAFCADHTVFFSHPDWLWLSERDGRGWDGHFASIPGDARRMGPNGDQCLLRNVAGPMSGAVCIEGPPTVDGDVVGPPREPYRDGDGRWHIDPWDICITRIFPVPP